MALLTPEHLTGWRGKDSAFCVLFFCVSFDVCMAGVGRCRPGAVLPGPTLGLQFFLFLHVVLPFRAWKHPGLDQNCSQSRCCAQWTGPDLLPLLKESVSPRPVLPCHLVCTSVYESIGSWARGHPEMWLEGVQWYLLTNTGSPGVRRGSQGRCAFGWDKMLSYLSTVIVSLFFLFLFLPVQADSC